MKSYVNDHNILETLDILTFALVDIWMGDNGLKSDHHFASNIWWSILHLTYDGLVKPLHFFGLQAFVCNTMSGTKWALTEDYDSVIFIVLLCDSSLHFKEFLAFIFYFFTYKCCF